MSGNAITRGAHHIGLTVPDLADTRGFQFGQIIFSFITTCF